MNMIKNLLETRSGKYLAAIFVVFTLALIGFLTSLIIISINGGENDELQDKQEEARVEFDDHIPGEILYGVNWYSNRPDRAVLSLREDGTYSGTAWLMEGEFSFENVYQGDFQSSRLILEDRSDGTFMLELHTHDGETVLYDPVGGYFFYSSREQLEEAVKVQQRFSELEVDVENQKWLDVLKQGTWAYYSVDGIEFSLNFSNGYFIIGYAHEETEDEAKFDYYLEDIFIFEDGVVGFNMQRRRQGDTLFLPASFQIEETSTRYVLTAQIGTFIWNNTFEKPIIEVELTQNGVDVAQRGQLQSVTIDEDGNRVIVKERVLE